MSEIEPRASDAKQREVARTLARGMNPAELAALASYVDVLFKIRASRAHPVVKAKQAWAATLSSEVVWPVVRAILVEIKHHAWNARGTKGRAGLASSVAAMAVFGSQGAGIAALGGAIGVPLWLVFGAGGAFLAGLYEELHDKKAPQWPLSSVPTSTKRQPPNDVIDVQAKTVETLALQIGTKSPSPTRETLAAGDVIDCAACGHSRKVTDHWLREVAKQRPHMLNSAGRELAPFATQRLRCASCGSKDLVVNHA